MKATIIIPVILATSLTWHPAYADTLSLGGGSLGILDGDAQAAMQLGYAAEPISGLWGIQPIGNLLLSEHSTYYLSGGLQKRFPLSDGWAWGVSAEAGYYHSGTRELDLGYDVIFRTRAFVDYQHWRAEFSHYSNADMGDHNPGSEALILSWTIPF